MRSRWGKEAVWLVVRGIAIRWVGRRVYSGEARGRGGGRGLSAVRFRVGGDGPLDRESKVSFWISGRSGGHTESW